MTCWSEPIISVGNLSKDWRLCFHKRPNLAILSATKFYPLGTYQMCHWSLLLKILCVLLRIVVPESSLSESVSSLSTSRQSVWMVAFWNPYFNKIMAPSKTPQSSASNGLQLPKKWLKPMIQLPSMSQTTSPAAACPVLFVTTPSVKGEPLRPLRILWIDGAKEGL